MPDFEKKASAIADDPRLSRREKSLLLSHLVLEAQTEYDNRISEIDAEIAGLGARGPGWFRSLLFSLFFPASSARQARSAYARSARSRLVAKKNRVRMEKRLTLLKLQRIKTGVRFFSGAGRKST